MLRAEEGSRDSGSTGSGPPKRACSSLGEFIKAVKSFTFDGGLGLQLPYHKTILDLGRAIYVSRTSPAFESSTGYVEQDSSGLGFKCNLARFWTDNGLMMATTVPISEQDMRPPFVCEQGYFISNYHSIYSHIFLKCLPFFASSFGFDVSKIFLTGSRV